MMSTKTAHAGRIYMGNPIARLNPRLMSKGIPPNPAPQIRKKPCSF
jgi:hypothetical protein